MPGASGAWNFIDAANDSASEAAVPYFKEIFDYARTLEVVPEFLRTLVFARPRGDDQFADCTFSPSLDMSR